MARWRYLVLIALAGFITSAALAAESRDVRFLAGLRQRQLFTLAEHWGKERLQRPGLAPAERTEIVTELVRTYAEHAANAIPDDQARLWNLAQKFGEDYLRAQPLPLRAELVRVQLALAKLTEGELARLNWEAQGRETAVDGAQQPLRTARRKLDEIQQQVAALATERRRKPAADGELTADELTSLSYQLIQQQARTLRNIALTYPAGDDNRLAALVEAIDLVKKPLTQLAADDARVAELKLEWLIAARLTGNSSAFAEMFTQLTSDDIPAAIRLPAFAEGIRQAITEQDFAKANVLVKQVRRPGQGTHPELDFAILELFVARWQVALKAKDRVATQAEQQNSIETARFIEQTHGAFWGRRADQLLIAALPASGATADADVLRKSAENLYRKGELAAAVTAYDKAAEQATQAKALGTAFDLRYKAAAIQQQRQEHADARQRLQSLALWQKDHPAAAEVHLLAAWNAARELGANGEDSVAADVYVAILKEHLTHWPSSPTCDQAHLWLGRMAEFRQDWPAAAENYRQVSSTSSHLETAINSLGDCWRRQLATAKGNETQKIVLAAEDYCRRIVMGEANAWPQEWTTTQRTAALVWGEFILDYRPAGLTDAEKVLTAAVRGNPPPTPEWKQRADTLLVIVYASQPQRMEQATELLQQLGNASTADLLSLVDRLTQSATRAPPQVKKGIAGLQLTTVQRLRNGAEKLTPVQRIAIDRIEAQALATQGDREKAIASFAKLATAQVNDPDVQEAYAELLANGTDRGSWDQALVQWRKIAAKSKPYTPRWCQAKYAIAELQVRMDDPAGVQLIRYLLETPPGLDPKFRLEFEGLLRKAEKRKN